MPHQALGMRTPFRRRTRPGGQPSVFKTEGVMVPPQRRVFAAECRPSRDEPQMQRVVRATPRAGPAAASDGRPTHAADHPVLRPSRRRPSPLDEAAAVSHLI